MKSDKKVRICADFKVSLNPDCNIEQYSMPSPKDIFANLAKGQHFTKLDLRHAYRKRKLSVDSQKYMVISTLKGLFTYRLQYELNSAVGILQQAMENALKNIPFIAVYLDDIIITATTIEEHYIFLELVLCRLHIQCLYHTAHFIHFIFIYYDC